MLSSTGEELMARLKGIYNNHDFVCGAMSNAKGDDSWQEIINFIETAERRGEKVTSDDILALSVLIGEKNSENPIKAAM